MEICPEQCGTSYTVRNRERAGPTENLLPPALYEARDWKLIGMLTGAHRTADHRPAGLLPPSGDLYRQ
jgi:hypothetical protein